MRAPLISVSLLALVAANGTAQNPGYTDTPMLPDGKWHVHDSARPHPTVVDPGPAGAPAPVPSDAIVLFAGKNLDEWKGNDGPAKWTVADGCMTVNGTGDVRTVREFGDCQLHVEWASPAEVKDASQGRGNSGVFFFERYEVQVLDSYDNVTYADGQAAALYGQHPPLVNACRKPGEWQSYDIVFHAPRFGQAGEVITPARVTAFHNGVLVHLERPLWGATAHRSKPGYKAHAARGPIRLQDHGNPVRFRNLWIRDLEAKPVAAAGPVDLDQAIAALKDRAEVEDNAISVRHILVSFAGAPGIQGVTRTKEEAKALAKDLFAQLQGGADFEALMKKYSSDPGGNTYDMTKATRRSMVQGFGDVGFRLKVDEIGVAPFDEKASPYGWHIIKRVK